MSEQLIQLILFILIYIYNVCQLNYFNKLLTTRFSSRMMIIFLSLFLTLVSMFLITYKIFIPLTYFILSIVLLISSQLFLLSALTSSFNSFWHVISSLVSHHSSQTKVCILLSRIKETICFHSVSPALLYFLSCLILINYFH